MEKKPIINYFTKEVSSRYDDTNLKLSPMLDNMHFLIRLILKNIPSNSRILCVGVGTGAEIFSLAKLYPDFKFVGVDPSEFMLEKCSERLKEEGIFERCELIHGFIEDIPIIDTFDAVLSILVSHFIKDDARFEFYKNMVDRLNVGGILINTEISCDLKSEEFPTMLKNWEQIQLLMGVPTEGLVNIPRQFTEMLNVLSNEKIENLISNTGIKKPIKFFQSFMITGWQAVKLI